VAELEVRLPLKTGRHDWSLGAAEQLILQTLIKTRGCRTAFEIGTFNGGTTRLIAEALPDDGQVWTIDLAPSDFDATQAPRGFAGSQVGLAYRDSPAASKITQLFGNSLAYDFSAYRGSADLVLVDAGHEYQNGFVDSKSALELVRPGGLILWDDFAPYWHGLVNGICEAMSGRELGRLAGTALAVYSET
jgi:predicted O-methyltransferase YrrM